MFFDTHVHVTSLDGEHGLAAMVHRARRAGVGRLIAVGGSDEANRLAVEAARRFSSDVSAAIGYDRDQAAGRAGSTEGLTAAIPELRSQIRNALEQGIRVVAIGEIGLDLHYSPETTGAQVRLLREQLRLAREFGLPVIVHSREADALTVVELRAHRDAWRGAADRLGVLHCFTGGAAFARQVLDLGFHISFSGILTFRNAAALREVAGGIPNDRLLIETDTPYLAPAPHRGQPNEPAFLPCVAATLAQARGAALESIASVTAANAARLFGWGEGIVSSEQ